MASNNTQSDSEAVLKDSQSLLEQLQGLQEVLTNASSKNETLLEAVETAEMKAVQSGNNELSLLRTLRARLAATHVPNCSLKRGLAAFSGSLKKRCQELETTLQENTAILKQVRHEKHDLEVRIKAYEEERVKFEEERQEWGAEMERNHQDILEQNDRLTVLSQTLAGTKSELDAKKNELAAQRIALEEERLLRQDESERIHESEADAIRGKLKEQVIRNIELEKALLKTELALHQKEESVGEMEERSVRLERDVLRGKIAASRAVQHFEKKTAEANKKLAQMNSELVKSQENARRFQDLLGGERRKQKALTHALEQELQKKSQSGGSSDDSLSPAAQKAYIETLAQTLSTTARANTRPEDMVRKSESVIIENANLHADVHRLRVENKELLKRVRYSDNNAHMMKNLAATNMADRAELMKRLEKAEAQYQELEQSLSRQARDWVAAKQEESKSKKTVRWSQVEPIPVLGASGRTWSSPPSRSQVQALSRSIPVHKW